MKRSKILVAALALAVAIAAQAAAQATAAGPTVSEKKDVAIFALGYYGWAIPLETLGSIDQEIQKVFVDLGRFTIVGVTQRLSSSGVQAFIDTIKKAKEANFVVPDKYTFGEATLTEAEFNKLLGAFVVAVPVVSEFNSRYEDKKGEWETDIKTNVSFIDVGAGGTLIGVAEVKSSGSDKSNQNKSISSAIEGIPMQLQYEVRKIPAFQISTRVLAVSGNEIKLQLGQNMGIKKGDEYSVVVGGTVEGFKDTREAGLVAIKDVGAEVSTGQVLYSGVKMTKDLQLQEIPRLGVDAEPFLHIVNGAKLDVPLDPKGTTGSNLIVGVRVPLSRGFYGVRPYGAIQVPVSGIRSFLTAFMIPVCASFGAEYRLNLGRLSLTPYGGVGASYIYVTEALSGAAADTKDTYIPHIGAQAYINAAFLITRDMRVFAEAGGEYWISLAPALYTNYGGIGFGAGVSFKL
jgi:hypothetical protein